jgi:hypothetical protein
MLTFRETNRPIAKIETGNDRGRILYLKESEEDTSCCSNCHARRCQREKPCCKNCFVYNEGGTCCNGGKKSRGRPKKLIKMMKDPLEDVNLETLEDFEDIDDKLKEIIIDEIKKIKGMGKTDEQKPFKEYTTKGVLQPLPSLKGRDCLFIAGRSGSGKSTYASEFIREYLKIHPRNNVYIFSRIKNDEVLDKIKPKPKRIIINDELVEDPIEPSELKNSVVLLDDIDRIPDKKQLKAISILRDQLLEEGRHEDITVITTAHQLMNYKSTRTSHNEASAVTFFPKGSGSYFIKEYLKKYAGFPKQTIEKLMNINSRWVTINQTYPPYIIHEHGAFVL